MKPHLFKSGSTGIMLTFVLWAGVAVAQNNSIILNGAYITLNGGTSGTPVYIVVNQSSNAGITRTSGHIISEGQHHRLKWMMGTGTGSYVVPFGYSTTAYLPITFNKTTAGSSDIDFATWGTNSQNIPKPEASNNGTVPGVNDMTGQGDSITTALDRFWDVHTSAPVTADLTFSYRAEENNTTSSPTDHVDAQHWNGTSWDPPLVGTHNGVVAGVGSTTISGASHFSPWVLVHGSMPLPVELVRFNVEKSTNGVLVTWTTASEVNNDYFTIQRSRDGLNFADVTTVSAGKEGNILQKYSYTDTNPFTGKSYYRLKQTDFDGRFEFSQVRKVEWDKPAIILTIYPNPVINGQFTIDFNHPTESETSVIIHDLLGRVIFNELVAPGVKKHDINFRPNSGVYLLKARNSLIIHQQAIVFN